MVERTSQSNARQPNPADSGSSPPVQPPNVDQASSDFASLMKKDRESSNEPAQGELSESNKQEREGQSVNKRKEDRGKSDDEGGEQSAEKGKERPATVRSPVTPGDAILARFAKTDATSPQVESSTQTSAKADLDGVVQQVADKILVSEASNGREVRIMLKDSVLPGTEVRITQDAGKMQVKFVTTSPDSQQLLANNQTSLQNNLNQRVSQHDFVVSVEMESSTDQDSSDGRSRNRREIDEIDDEK